MNERFVAHLDSIDDHAMAFVGPKAASLVRLTRLGLAVSPGFCVLAGAYRAHLKTIASGSTIGQWIDDLSNAPPGDVSRRLADVRSAIVEAKLTRALVEAIDEHHASLGSSWLAVRSSATAEDLPGHSFAGQHDTFLDVSGLDDCVHRIKECWASIWTERAFAYRKKHCFAHNAVDMGVIVQALVAAETSGVLFTADPVTGDKERVVIEACWGLGETLVSGKVAPDRYVLELDSFRILENSVSEKVIELTVDDEGELSERTVDSERRQISCLTETHARQLAESACRVAAAEGFPQDIEWSVCGGEIVFHQARPISVEAPKPSWESRQVWFNANVGEVLPDVVTPLTWSLIDTFDAMLRSFHGWMGIEWGDHPILGRVAGRVYFNLNTAAGLFRRLPVLRNADITKVLGGDQDKAFQAGDLDIADEDIPDVKVRLWKMFMRMPWFAFQALRHSPKNGARFARRLNERIETLKRTDPRTLSNSALLDFVQQRFDELHQVVEGVAFQCSAMAYFTILEKICVRWLDDQQLTITNRLLSGMGGVDSAEAGLAMWKLAHLAGTHADLAAVTETADNWGAFHGAVENVEGGPEFLEAWHDFMARHGHHCRGELEFANPRWAESPDYVFDQLCGFLQRLGDHNPVATHAERRREREALIQECRAKLRNPLKRWLFNHSLARAQLASAVRENLKSVTVRHLTLIRQSALELGKRLVDEGKFLAADDIFFLSMAEIGPVSQDASAFQVAETIQKRRQDYESNLALNPPSIVVGEYHPQTHPNRPMPVEGAYLDGIAVSAGIARGPARVILRADENAKVLPGEILVAPFTDPGWTPYFIPAVGIVMDLGGQLSHGSIVAREYGIPAVVNVGPATRLIKTGQQIEVDGNRGRVRLSDG